MSIDSTVARRMTMAQEARAEKKFVPCILPWLVAAGALSLYLITLNHWVSFSSLGPVAQVSGWVWSPPVTEPLFWLIVFPFRWLPITLIPIALNVFSAVCAALTLALLARSVALLPHDRTEEQRLRERSPFSLLSIPAAWVPPVLACLICGLQLTFWENATAASSEMLNILLFAYIIRCLLEFRLSERDSWLLRAALVYGAGMTNNWAMIGFFPLFLVALVWLKGVAFFNTRFLGRMFLLGCAGLALYLLLPILASSSSTVHVSFWQALAVNVRNQKDALFLMVFNKQLVLHGDHPLWVLALPSLLPVLALSVRWPSYFGDPSKLGVTLATLVLHIFSAVLLLLCSWVALDPAVSPRHYGLSSLPFYYLGALSIGYFSGYFLLVFGARPVGRPRSVPVHLRLVNRSVLCGFWLVIILVSALLIYRNVPQVRITNGPWLQQYTDLQVESLPPNGAVLLSDNPTKVLLLQSRLTQARKETPFLFACTHYLVTPDYHSFLHRIYGQRWPSSDPPKDQRGVVLDRYLADIAFQMARTNSVYYLHPSYGYYFEELQAEARGLVYHLTPYSTNLNLSIPEPTQEVMAENEGFWNRINDNSLRPIVAAVAIAATQEKPSLLERLAQALKLTKDLNGTAAGLGSFYSQALDFWGVQMQRADKLVQAAAHFQRASELNPDNVAAQVNLDYNRNLQAGHKKEVNVSKSIRDQFGKYRGWEEILTANGPFDEPSFCFEQGLVFLRGQNFRQAAQEFARVIELAPDTVLSRIYLAQLYLRARMPDPALKLVKEIHDHTSSEGSNSTNQLQVAYLEAAAHLAKGELKSAESVIQGVIDKDPGNELALVVASQVYMDFQCYTNLLGVLEQRLKIRPNDPIALWQQGYAYSEVGDYEHAIPALTRVIELVPNQYDKWHRLALWRRAETYLKIQQLTRAQRDFEVLQKLHPTLCDFDYALADIALQKQETNSAIRYYQLYLANNPATNSAEVTNVLARLQDLKRSSH
jgi:tetratricopeptide (TPR) repeat protein